MFLYGSLHFFPLFTNRKNTASIFLSFDIPRNDCIVFILFFSIQSESSLVPKNTTVFKRNIAHETLAVTSTAVVFPDSPVRPEPHLFPL